MKRRRMLIEADPKRQEAKAKKRLEKLKKKMEAIQQKKAQSAASKSKEEETETAVKDESQELLLESRKRKRDEDDAEVEENAVKQEEEEAAQLESALDMLQDDTGLAHKTREEAEIDRQKLLAGAGLQWDEEDDVTDTKHDMSERKMSQEELEAEILRRSGVVIVSDDEATVIGGNKILPWRRGYKSLAVKKEEICSDESSEPTRLNMKPRVAIKFKSEFPGLIELDANGRVIDKGDDDYMPSSKWIGRKGGFEFKLGERGLGYYRTGKKVVVPSNVAYA